MDEPGAHQSPAWWRTHPGARDALLGAAVAALILVMTLVGRPGETEGRPLAWPDALAAGAAFTLVLVRRQWPLPVLAVSALLAAGAVAAGGQPPAFLVVTAVAAYTVAAHTNRPTAWLSGGGAAVVVYGAAVAWTGEGWLGPPLGVAAWIGMATAIGDAARIRRAYVSAVEERARRAERTREEEARRRVAEERVRIARDLHDVVAHHIAVINVHAGLAEHSVHTRPDQAAASVAHVRQAARTVLDELTTILALLRQNGDADAPTEPVRGLAQLGELLDSVAAAGLRVEHQQVGPARPLPAAIDQAAYRIVQEALTNAHKHGTGDAAGLQVEYRPDDLVIDIDNPTGSGHQRSDPTGHGLIGMRERAVAVGGSLAAGPAGAGRFHVRAVLPSTARPGGTP
ncbi:Signal transduction histidine kinase [Micromonospora haikouensis]|uniref:histidine kinase n=1 Tax=Micromonospora haikouensis TaxID=686309 RepID=A0A1C4YRZ0_9ACTN|nr:histidine kinase [Micromonospora haikouensis]SCF23417.1 Signal transduction histidine kinase [Micromonospora haikouensis]